MAVVVWGVRSEHRQVVVSHGSYEDMRAEALALVRAAGVDTLGTVVDIATASTAIKGANRQPVVLALANADDVSPAVRPLVEARVRIRSVMTPADALLGLARSRQACAVPGGIEAYVALDTTVLCIALIRDGSLLGARELPWGYEDGSGARGSPQDADVVGRRDDLAARLVDAPAELLTTVGAERNAVTQVSICGGLPDLRTMTVRMMERLDIEVEALDSLFGMDVERLPEPEDEIRERAAELRLAWAAAADWPSPINLMRRHHWRNRRVVLARAAVVAGIATGLGAGWAIEQSRWWQSTSPEPIARTTPSPIVPPTPSAPPAVLRAASPVTTPPPQAPTPSAATTAKPPTLPAGPVVSSAAPPAVWATPPPVPFDAVLGTILHSPDRKFAIVNGRIVGPGDEVNGARIVDITPTRVLLRDAQGRLRSLTLRAAGRAPVAP